MKLMASQVESEEITLERETPANASSEQHVNEKYAQHICGLEKEMRISTSVIYIQSTTVNSYPDYSDFRLIRVHPKPSFYDNQSNIMS